MVIAGDVDLAFAWDKDPLMLERVGAPHGAIIDRDEIFVVEGLYTELRKPLRRAGFIKDEVRVARRLQTPVEILHGGFVLFAIWLDYNWHRVGRLSVTGIIWCETALSAK